MRPLFEFRQVKPIPDKLTEVTVQVCLIGQEIAYIFTNGKVVAKITEFEDLGYGQFMLKAKVVRTEYER